MVFSVLGARHFILFNNQMGYFFYTLNLYDGNGLIFYNSILQYKNTLVSFPEAKQTCTLFV